MKRGRTRERSGRGRPGPCPRGRGPAWPHRRAAPVLRAASAEERHEAPPAECLSKMPRCGRGAVATPLAKCKQCPARRVKPPPRKKVVGCGLHCRA